MIYLIDVDLLANTHAGVFMLSPFCVFSYYISYVKMHKDAELVLEALLFTRGGFAFYKALLIFLPAEV